jgi:hypothetical protein
MKKPGFLVALFFLAFVLAIPTPAFAGGLYTNAYCASIGGTWSGSDAVNGACTFAANGSTAVSACGVDSTYVVTVDTGNPISSSCIPVLNQENSDSTENHEGDGTEPTTLNLGGDNNGSATFPPGTCPQKCTITPSLPVGAGNSLPGNAVATMYVRVVDEGGASGTGSYTACFNNAGGQPLVIYKYVGGAWVAQTVASTSERICVSSSGDGAFYLGS